MNSTELTESPMPDTSVELDVGSPASPSVSEHKEVPDSRMSAIERAAADLEAKEVKEVEKPTADAKDEESAEEAEKPPVSKDEKPVVEVKDTKVAEKPAVETETVKRNIIEAPQNFLPKAKAVWNNVPHPVREEFQRVMKEASDLTEKSTEAVKEYETIREYAQLAKQNNTTIRDALDKYVGLERAFASDPSNGFKTMLSNMQMNPKDAISHILRAYNVSPEMLARSITENPREYTALASRSQPQPQPQQQYQQPQENPEIAQMKAQLQDMQLQSVIQKVIEPFAAANPDYYQYESQVHKVLETGLIDSLYGSGLSASDKLEAALNLVRGNKPSAVVAEVAPVVANKAIKNSPGAEVKGGKNVKGVSRSDAIASAAAELGIFL